MTKTWTGDVPYDPLNPPPTGFIYTIVQCPFRIYVLPWFPAYLTHGASWNVPYPVCNIFNFAVLNTQFFTVCKKYKVSKSWFIIKLLGFHADDVTSSVKKDHLHKCELHLTEKIIADGPSWMGLSPTGYVARREIQFFLKWVHACNSYPLDIFFFGKSQEKVCMCPNCIPNTSHFHAHNSLLVASRLWSMMFINF